MAAEKLSSAKAEISPSGGLKMTIRLEKPSPEAETVCGSSEWITEKRGNGIGKLVLKRRSVTTATTAVSPEVLHEVAFTRPSPTLSNILRLTFGSNASDGTLTAQIKNCNAYDSVGLPMEEVQSGSEMSPACHLQPSPKDSGIDISSPPRDDGHLSGVLLGNDSHDEGTSSTTNESASIVCIPINTVRTSDSLSSERFAEKADFFDMLNSSTKWTASSKVQSTLRTKAERCAETAVAKTVEKSTVISRKLSKLNDGTNSWAVSRNESSLSNRKRKASLIDESATYNLTATSSAHTEKPVNRERVVLRLKQGKPETVVDNEDRSAKKKVKIEGSAGTKLRFKCYSRVPKANEQQYFVEVPGVTEKQKGLKIAHQTKTCEKQISKANTTSETQSKSALPSLKCKLKPTTIATKVLHASSNDVPNPSISAILAEQSAKKSDNKNRLCEKQHQNHDGRPSKRLRSNKLKATSSSVFVACCKSDNIKLEETKRELTAYGSHWNSHSAVKSPSVAVLGVETVSVGKIDVVEQSNFETNSMTANKIVDLNNKHFPRKDLKHEVLSENEMPVEVELEAAIEKTVFTTKSCQLSPRHIQHGLLKEKSTAEIQCSSTLPSLKCKLKPFVTTSVRHSSTNSASVPKQSTPDLLAEQSKTKADNLNKQTKEDQIHDSKPSKRRRSHKLKAEVSSDLEAGSKVDNVRRDEISSSVTTDISHKDGTEAIISLSDAVLCVEAASCERLSVGNVEVLEPPKSVENIAAADVSLKSVACKASASEVFAQGIISGKKTPSDAVSKAVFDANKNAVLSIKGCQLSPLHRQQQISKEKTTTEEQRNTALPSIKCKLKPFVTPNVRHSSADNVSAQKQSIAKSLFEQSRKKPEKVREQSKEDQNHDTTPSKRRRSNKLKADLSSDSEAGSTVHSVRLEEAAIEFTTDGAHTECHDAIKSVSQAVSTIDTVSCERLSVKEVELAEHLKCAGNKAISDVSIRDVNCQVSAKKTFEREVTSGKQMPDETAVIDSDEKTVFNTRGCQLTPVYLQQKITKEKSLQEIQCIKALPSLKCRLKPFVTANARHSSTDIESSPKLSTPELLAEQSTTKTDKVNQQTKEDQMCDTRPSKKRRSNKLKVKSSSDLQADSKVDSVRLDETASSVTMNLLHSDGQKAVKSQAVIVLGVKTVSCKRRAELHKSVENKPVADVSLENVDYKVSASEVLAISGKELPVEVESEGALEKTVFTTKSSQLSPCHLQQRLSKEKSTAEVQCNTALPSLKCKLKPYVTPNVRHSSADSESAQKQSIAKSLFEQSRKKPEKVREHFKEDQNHDTTPSKRRCSNKLKTDLSSDSEAGSTAHSVRLEETAVSVTTDMVHGDGQKAVKSLSVNVLDVEAVSHERLSVGKVEVAEKSNIAENRVNADVNNKVSAIEMFEPEVASKNEKSFDVVSKTANRVHERTVSVLERCTFSPPHLQHCDPVAVIDGESEVLCSAHDSDSDRIVSALQKNVASCVDMNTIFDGSNLSDSCSIVTFESDTHVCQHSVISTGVLLEGSRKLEPQLDVDSAGALSFGTDLHQHDYISVNKVASEPNTQIKTIPTCDEALSVETCLEAEVCHNSEPDDSLSVNGLKHSPTPVSSSFPFSGQSSFIAEFASFVCNRVDGEVEEDRATVGGGINFETTDENLLFQTQFIIDDSWMKEQAGSIINDSPRTISANMKSSRNICRRQKMLSITRHKSKSCSRCDGSLGNRTASANHINVDRCMSGHRRLVSLRHKVCDFLDAVFPTFEYPKGFQRDSSSVERLIDKIVRVLHSTDNAKAECNSSSCSEPFVDICSSPDRCARNLQSKALRLISALLPDIDISDIADDETLEVLLELLTSLNRHTSSSLESDVGFVNLGQNLTLHTSGLLSSLPGACVSSGVMSPQHLNPESLTPILFGSMATAKSAATNPVVNKKALKRQVKNCLMFLDKELT